VLVVRRDMDQRTCHSYFTIYTAHISLTDDSLSLTVRFSTFTWAYHTRAIVNYNVYLMAPYVCLCGRKRERRTHLPAPLPYIACSMLSPDGTSALISTWTPDAIDHQDDGRSLPNGAHHPLPSASRRVLNSRLLHCSILVTLTSRTLDNSQQPPANAASS